jgi:hypothetical protein
VIALVGEKRIAGVSLVGQAGGLFDRLQDRVDLDLGTISSPLGRGYYRTPNIALNLSIWQY